MSFRLAAVEPRAHFKLWIRFQDGIEGEADLSDVAGRGVFQRWTDNPKEFFEVSIDPISGAPTWPGGLDVAPDRLHDEMVASSHKRARGPV